MRVSHQRFTPRLHQHADLGVRHRILRFQPCRDRPQVGPRLRHGHAALQARDGTYPHVIAAIDPGGIAAVQADRHKNLAVPADGEEIGGKNAGHCVGNVVQNDRLTHSVAVAAEFPLREAVGQHGDGGRAGLVVGVAVKASGGWFGAEQAKQAGRGHQGADDFRSVAASKVVGAGAHRGHRFERAVLGAPVLEIGPSHRHMVGAAHGIVEQHEPVGIGIGQRFQQHAAHHGKNRCVGADAQGQGDDRHQREAGVIKKAPQTEAQVLNHRGDQSASAGPSPASENHTFSRTILFTGAKERPQLNRGSSTVTGRGGVPRRNRRHALRSRSIRPGSAT